MNIQTRPIKIPNIGLGDKVSISITSTRSMSLFTDLKIRGIKNLHCPCGYKSIDALEVVQVLKNGFLLKEVNSARLTCGAFGDVKKWM